MQDIVRKRLVGAVVLVLVGITLPFLLSRCMHGPSQDDQAMRVYEVTPSGGVEPINQPVAGATDDTMDGTSAPTPPTAVDTTAPTPTTTTATAAPTTPTPTAPKDTTQSMPAGAAPTPDEAATTTAAAQPADESSLRKNATAGSWAVQVASFAAEKDAQALAQRLDDAYDVFYTSAQVDGNTWFRVRIGPFGSDAAAKNAAAELRAQGRDTLVVRVD